MLVFYVSRRLLRQIFIFSTVDPTTFSGITYNGQGSRVMFDGRNGGRWITVNAFLFTATFSDHSSVEFRCNPEYGQVAANIQASKYAKALGRIPEVFRSRVDIFDLNRGTFVTYNGWGYN